MASSDEELPPSILDIVNNLDLLPEKSANRYKKEYNIFMSWCKEKSVNSLKEEVFLAYFSSLSKICKPNTLWSRYSMLKAVLKIEKNVNIGDYFKLTAYLKKKNVGFTPKKAKIFTKEEISKFLSEAPDDIYLMIKVAAIFGLAGACRREELMKITIDDIVDKGDFLLVRIPDSKNHTSRSFVISNEVNDGKYVAVYRKYANLRKLGTPHKRFFVHYKKGVCTIQCVGINTFGKFPSEIAAYLKLPNPELYTGHSFRRSSATMLADSGEGITNIKRLGGWKSTSVAEGYLEESTELRKNMSNQILSCQKSAAASTSKHLPMPMTVATEDEEVELPAAFTTSKNLLSSAINLHNATSCTFNINIVNKK